jgi:kexin
VCIKRSWCVASLFVTLLLSGCGGGSGSSNGSVDNAGDPLFADQWHLDNTGQFVGTRSGEDINVIPVWNDGVKGAGVLVAVVDDGLQLGHEDLAANIAANKSWDYRQSDNDPSPASENYHGTFVAGVLGARDQNGLGLRGVAPRASLAGYNLLWNNTVLNTELYDAMTRNLSEVGVSSNSWGLSVDGLGEAEPPTDTFWHDGVERGVLEGRGGKGTVYVWAAGNGREDGGQDNSNYDYQANNRHVIAVCAVDGRGQRASYSEVGANLWLCAPGGANFLSGGGMVSLGLPTTDLMGAAGCNGDPDCQVGGDYQNRSYTRAFLGTSAATPVVSGVVALMLQVNPALGWRDVRLILAQTARRNDSLDADWSLTVPHTGQPQYSINHQYGFGVVDAAAAVARAKTWTNVGPQQIVERSVANVQAIPDNIGTALQQQVSVSADLVIEYVEIDINTNHIYAGDLEIVLSAPSGTDSVLAETHDCLIEVPGQTPGQVTYQVRFGTCAYGYNPWTFGSSRHLGEGSSGVWRLTLRDQGNQGSSGDLIAWTLRIYGRAP